MSASTILFRTDRFNLSEVQDHFINPCCFGEDVAVWLKAQLASRGIESTDPDQEDWGWYIEPRLGEVAYLVGIGGVPDDEDSGSNSGVWRFIIERRRSLKDRITGRGKDVSEMQDVLLTILREEPSITEVDLEEAA